GIVPGRDGRAAEGARALPERGELDLGVAGRARDRRVAGEVGADEGPDDVAPELLLEIEHVVADPQRPRRAARIAEIIERAAAPRTAGVAGVVPELHREAHDLVALVAEKERGHRRVDAARHGHRDT